MSFGRLGSGCERSGGEEVREGGSDVLGRRWSGGRREWGDGDGGERCGGVGGGGGGSLWSW